jgi:hypothetical protein
MPGRLLSLVVVIVLAAAPLGRALCEVSCADGLHGSHSGAHAHHAPAGSTHDHSAMHDSNTAAATDVCRAPSVSAFSCCTDAERLPTSVVPMKVGMEAPVIEVSFFTAVDHQARHVSMVTIQSRAPAASPPSLNTPLRV